MLTFRTVFLLLLGSLFLSAFLPSNLSDKTNWITLEQAAAQMKNEKRPILIDLYTDWCGWCKVMDRKTYSNKKVVAYLGEKFYTVKVNAESKLPISWKGQNFLYNNRYKAHDFAIFLTQGQLSYPTTIILTPDGAPPQAIPGYMEPKDFELIVKYFGEGHYGKLSFAEFKSGFKSTW